MEKNSLKSNLKFQHAQINGSEVKTSDNKIHNFSITKLGKKKKKKYARTNRNNNSQSTAKF